MSSNRRLHPAWLLLGATWLLIAGFVFLSRTGPAPPDAVAEVPALAPPTQPEPRPKASPPAQSGPRPTHTARPTYTPAPTYVSTPRLRVRVLEAIERRPLPWVEVSLVRPGEELGEERLLSIRTLAALPFSIGFSQADTRCTRGQRTCLKYPTLWRFPWVRMRRSNVSSRSSTRDSSRSSSRSSDTMEPPFQASNSIWGTTGCLRVPAVPEWIGTGSATPWKW